MKSSNRNSKIWILILTTLFSGLAHAAPRMDTVIGTNAPKISTVLPDHQDPNLYYVFPQMSEVVVKPNGKQDFLYVETRKYGWGNYQVEAAHLTLGIVPSIKNPDLTAKVAEIKATNPNAKFAVVTAFESRVAAQDDNHIYFEGHYCPEVNGPLEVPIYCEVDINPLMAKAFRKIIGATDIRIFQLVYKFYGFVDGKIQVFTYSLPIRVGTLTDDYAFDQYGEKI